MKRLDDNLIPPQHRRPSPVEPAEQPQSPGAVILTDRQAVVAIMFANGLTCEEISARLAMALETVHSYLAETLRILDLIDIEDLTFAVVASYYNRDISSTGET